MEPPARKTADSALQRTAAEAEAWARQEPVGLPVFDVRNVSIYYGAFKAVTDVSLPVYGNEITAFIGSSGSGKSTVLRAFNRMNDLVPG
ncbi:MAG: ATP-binding cassette domain-containing protein, partial [Actinomycetia bacterium]|nr:ATP-binding cassette domain-containing protein [Actinomycetes bacterium]